MITVHWHTIRFVCVCVRARACTCMCVRERRKIELMARAKKKKPIPLDGIGTCTSEIRAHRASDYTTRAGTSRVCSNKHFRHSPTSSIVKIQACIGVCVSENDESVCVCVRACVRACVCMCVRVFLSVINQCGVRYLKKISPLVELIQHTYGVEAKICHFGLYDLDDYLPLHDQVDAWNSKFQIFNSYLYLCVSKCR